MFRRMVTKDVTNKINKIYPGRWGLRVIHHNIIHVLHLRGWVHPNIGASCVSKQNAVQLRVKRLEGKRWRAQ